MGFALTGISGIHAAMWLLLGHPQGMAISWVYGGLCIPLAAVAIWFAMRNKPPLGGVG